jgi:Ca2+-transporting ATPase
LTATLLYAVALAVAAVPEGLSAITTVVLSLGMQRLARRNVIIRRLSAVETLGAATVICSDKTGTLTRNEMTVRALVTASGRVEFTGSGYDTRGELRSGGAPVADRALRQEIEAALEAGFVSNNAELVDAGGVTRVAGDPTEGALKVAALKAGLHGARLDARFPRIGEIPFSSERKLMSTAHAAPSDETPVLFVKGAPDVLLARCRAERVGADERPLDNARRRAIQRSIERLADDAMRTLGIACRSLVGRHGASALHPGIEQELVWLGVLGMLDPPRPETHQAVHTARAAGVRVIMITGDHPRSAAAIAHDIGIIGAGARVVTGGDIAAMDEAALTQVVADVDVYARVSPEHKLRIVHALKRLGHVVAMTGDGVNDAPALKAADIGVAMGAAGTDVAKGAADMVLLDDNFASIVAAIEEGRSIYSNIQKFLRYLLATNLGEVAVMFLGVVGAGLLGITAESGTTLILPLTAAMILWINLVTDSGPALAIGVDPPDARLMARPPRRPSLGIITPQMWRGVTLVAAAMGIGTLGVLDAALPGGLIAGDGSIEHARTLAFHTLVLFSLFAVFGARSDEASAARHLFANRWLWVTIALAIVLQLAVLYAPPLQRGFDTVALSGRDWAIALAVASSALCVRELEKWLSRVRARRAHTPEAAA